MKEYRQRQGNRSVDTGSDSNQPAKQPRPRLDEIMQAAKRVAPSRQPSLNRGEAYWFEPATHPGMNEFWGFPK
jgi:hypothetical protein